MNEKESNLEGIFKGANFNGANLQIQVGNNNTQYQYGNRNTDSEPSTMPTAETMVKVVESTISKGLWWGNTAWSVVFRIMQLSGYKGSISQFVREVETWPFSYKIPYSCNIDSISKPLRKGTLSRGIDNWNEDGAQKQYIILANEITSELKEE